MQKAIGITLSAIFLVLMICALVIVLPFVFVYLAFMFGLVLVVLTGIQLVAWLDRHYSRRRK